MPVNYFTPICIAPCSSKLWAKTMDEHPSARIPKWLIVDLTLIVVGFVLAVLGVWLGLADIPAVDIVGLK